jgi:hypothetical protein
MKSTDNPMHPAVRLADAPRCTATAKTTRCRCKGPAVKGWSVCRMHGAGGGAPTGPSNGAWVHGDRSQAVEQNRRNLMALVKLARDSLDQIELTKQIG